MSNVNTYHVQAIYRSLEDSLCTVIGIAYVVVNVVKYNVLASGQHYWTVGETGIETNRQIILSWKEKSLHNYEILFKKIISA